MVFVIEKIFSILEAIFSKPGTVVDVSGTIVDVPETIFSKPENAVDVPETIFSGIETSVSTIKSMVFVVEATVRGTKILFLKVESIFCALRPALPLARRPSVSQRRSCTTARFSAELHGYSAMIGTVSCGRSVGNRSRAPAAELPG